MSNNVIGSVCIMGLRVSVFKDDDGVVKTLISTEVYDADGDWMEKDLEIRDMIFKLFDKYIEANQNITEETLNVIGRHFEAFSCHMAGNMVIDSFNYSIFFKYAKSINKDLELFEKLFISFIDMTFKNEGLIKRLNRSIKSNVKRSEKILKMLEESNIDMNDEDLKDLVVFVNIIKSLVINFKDKNITGEDFDTLNKIIDDTINLDIDLDDLEDVIIDMMDDRKNKINMEFNEASFISKVCTLIENICDLEGIDSKYVYDEYDEDFAKIVDNL